jgi:YbbR domain-containing protein
MSKEYETVVTIPISLINIPENIKLVNTPDDELSVKVRSHGFYLLRNNIFKYQKLTISIKDLEESNKKSLIQKRWVAKKKYKLLYNLFSSDIKILSTSPDTIKFNFRKKESKKITVQFNGDIQFSSQFRLKDDVVLFPDSILVYGTKQALSNLSFVETENIKFSSIEEDVKQNVSLEVIDGLNFSTDQIEISFVVEKFTEKAIELPVNPINVPVGYKIKFYPPKVEVITTVSFADYDKITPSMFFAEVDASELNEKKKLEVNLSSKPSFVDVVKVNPRRVEFLLIKQ